MGTKTMTICLLTPGHLSTDPRLIKEADALAAANYDVNVIATDYALWARDADRLFQGRSWKIAHTIAFGPHSSLPSRIGHVLRQHLALMMVARGASHWALLRAACHPIAPDLVKAAVKNKADLYIAHYPAALPAAAIAAQRHQARYAFDAEDFHLSDVADGPAHDTERRVIRAIEARYLPKCAYVTTASPGIADAYVDTYGISRPVVLLNVFPRSHAKSAPTSRGTAAPAPSLYWFSQTIGPNRGLECAVRAVGLARTTPHLYLRGTQARGFADHLRKMARELGVAERIHFLPPAPPAEMERLAATYDVGLVGEVGGTPDRSITLTNKLFTYLLAGIPVVMSDIAAHRAIIPAISDAARLYPVDDPFALAVALDALLGDPALLAAARNLAWRLGQERFNWDVEQTRLLGCVRAAFGGDDHSCGALKTFSSVRSDG